MASTDQNIPWFKEAEKYPHGKQRAEHSSKENSWPWPIAPRHATSMLCSPHPVFCFNWIHCTEAGSMIFNAIPTSFKLLSTDHSY